MALHTDRPVMKSEELRPMVLHVLKNIPADNLQVLNIIYAVEDFGVQKDIFPSKTGQFWTSSSRERLMPDQDRENVRQIIWQLVMEGILVPGLNELNLNLPFLRVTDYGKECLSADAIIPHDPDGYLKSLKQAVPSLDPTIEMYVSEALQAFLKGLMLSSTVMLGGASEKAFLILFDTYVHAIADPKRKAKFQGIQNSFIKTKFETFLQDFESVKKGLPKDLREDIDLQLTAIFSLIRITRNDVGHPSGRVIDRDLAYSNLRIFIPYVRRIYDLVTWFSQNPA